MNRFSVSPTLNGKYRGQRQFIVAALLSKAEGLSLPELVKAVDVPAYWSTVKIKDRNEDGVVIPAAQSWFVTKAHAVEGSCKFHLRELRKAGELKEASVEASTPETPTTPETPAETTTVVAETPTPRISKKALRRLKQLEAAKANEVEEAAA